jgi:hypothetical protein
MFIVLCVICVESSLRVPAAELRTLEKSQGEKSLVLTFEKSQGEKSLVLTFEKSRGEKSLELTSQQQTPAMRIRPEQVESPLFVTSLRPAPRRVPKLSRTVEIN